MIEGVSRCGSQTITHRNLLLVVIAQVRDGRAGVQDEGSQLVTITLADAPPGDAGECWLDLCAGPGGKAALLGVSPASARRVTRLALGERWLPMVPAFRLMAGFTLLGPIRVTVSRLFIAVGRPEEVVWTGLAQLGTMGVGLFALGSRWGITGVAVVVDGLHMCMAMRGVKKSNARMRTSALLGTFADNPKTRAEFMEHIGPVTRSLV